ncbi:hypothetical protein F511_30599 [Dorcoceras hygrometricum]|uniref:Zinc finger BED domain-containing protein RICESLEEPER 2-like n=1 Tax=Dorcoceras hygrometricum TaxID=472368 RepID=A0A2Z7A666_9LAMI|nr:hypothetical protein F511_30599 [Dorcoceras hygrometricum]
MVVSKSKVLDVEALREALAKMCIIDEHSFRIVEVEVFRLLIRIAEPRWTVPCRKTVASECFKLYDKEKVLMKSKLSLTTDCWSSIQNLGYLTLTAHFIDDDWKLQKLILNFSLVENHRGQTIGRIVESCLVDWGFDKIFILTVDMSNKYIHVRCVAHIVEGLKDQDFSIQRIRNAMKFVRSSQQRNKKFQECVLFEKIEVCLDVETPWNSSYLMLETAVKYRKAFDRLRREGSGYQLYFYGYETHNRKNAIIGPPNEVDWLKAEAFVRFLKLFYDATLAFSGSNYVTCALLFRQVVLMHLTIKRMQNSDDLVMKEMAYSMREKFEKYWVDSTCRNNLLLLGVVFDPRYKFKHVEFCFEQIYWEDGRKAISDKGKNLMMDVKLELEALVGDYVNRLSSSEKVASTEMMEMSNSKDEQSVETKCELTRYLHEACEKDYQLDILHWWKSNSSRYPIMSKVAKDVLAILVFTVASEQYFGTSGRILNEFRSSLKPKTVEMLVCAQNWFPSTPKAIDIREMMDDVEKYEEIINGKYSFNSKFLLYNIYFIHIV